MGTRHLIAVYKDGQPKIAQYGQWDGYPSGQGVDVLKFLREADLDKFKEQIDPLEWATEDGQWEDYMARDLGADILNVVHYGKYEQRGFLSSSPTVHEFDNIKYMKNSISFSGDSLFCEWAYVIDLDEMKLEVYRGFNQEPVPEDSRFAAYFDTKQAHRDDKYHPVTLQKVYDIDSLPSDDDFVKEFEQGDEDED